MAQVTTKFIKDNAVTDSKILLANQGPLRSENAAGTGSVGILEVDASNTTQFLSVPQTPSNPVQNNDVSNKSYVDGIVGGTLDKVKTEYFTLSGTDISNGFITLSNPAFADSVYVEAGGVGQYAGVDYSLSVPSVNTQVNFLTPLSGILLAGDMVVVSYNVSTSVGAISPSPINLLKEVAVVLDLKPDGTGAGTPSTTGSWLTRDLTTVQSPQAWLSLASNQFTLQPGQYEIEAKVPGFSVNHHQAKLRDITNSADALIGYSAYAEQAQAAEEVSCVEGVLTVTAPTTYAVQQQVQTAASSGFGVQANFGVGEVYTQLKVSKLTPVGSFSVSNSTGASFVFDSTLVQITDASSVPLQAIVYATGKAVEVGLQDDGTGGGGSIVLDHTPAESSATISFYMDGVLISNQVFGTQNNGGINILTTPPSAFRFVHVPPVGQHTYTVSIQGQSNRGDQSITYTTLYAKA